MPQDAFTLNYLCRELNSLLLNGKINRIVQTSENEIIFSVYTGKRTLKLLLDVNPSAPKISITDKFTDAPLTAPNFCMLLRKHLENGAIKEVGLIGFDRIVKIVIEPYNEYFDSAKKELYVELMGRYSNVILTENGKILGGNRGINMFDDGVRPLIVGKPYVYPPAQNKLEPNDVNLAKIFSNFNVGCGDFADFICKYVQGIAKSTAVEIKQGFCRVHGINSDNELEESLSADIEPFMEYFLRFLYDAKKSPCVIEKDNQVIDVCVFPYSNISGDIKSFESLYLAEDYYFLEKDKAKNFKVKQDMVLSITGSTEKKIKKRLVSINSKMKDALNGESYRIKGELLVANLYRLKDFVSSCEVENYYDDNKPIAIELDKCLTINQNSQTYFKKYNKAKRTVVALTPQKESAEEELNYILSIKEELNVCDSIDDLDLIIDELVEMGLKKVQKSSKKQLKKVIGREYYIDGHKVLVGRNNIENDMIVKNAKADSIWMHAKDFHSSHVIIEKGQDKIQQKTIERAAEICAYYSSLRDSGKAEIAYTERKNVKKPSHSKPGKVYYDNFTSIMVTPKINAEFVKTN